MISAIAWRLFHVKLFFSINEKNQGRRQAYIYKMVFPDIVWRVGQFSDMQTNRFIGNRANRY